MTAIGILSTRSLFIGRCCLVLVAGLAGPQAAAQVLVSDGDYTQNFDTLASSGIANPWSDNVTLPGWYAAAVNGFGDYRAGIGTATAGDLYSFGTGGDRALGSIASGTPGNLAYGLRIRNDTALARTITVSYTGEQWRDANTTPHTLQFSYQSGSAALTSADAANAPGAGGWLMVAGLDFTSPQSSGALGLDGNAAGNRTLFASVPLTGLVLGSGEELFLRWFDANDLGSDHSLAIDDVAVAFGAVPEPEEWASIVGVLLLVLAVYHRHRTIN